MKCLSVQQPWAWAIIDGHKTVENRSWPTAFRGLLAIHAGKSRASMRSGSELCSRLGHVVPIDLPFGAIVGVVKVIDCVPVAGLRGNPWASGPWCWVLEGAEALAEPVPFAGRLGLFDLPAGVVGRGLLGDKS